MEYELKKIERTNRKLYAALVAFLCGSATYLEKATVLSAELDSYAILLDATTTNFLKSIVIDQLPNATPEFVMGVVNAPIKGTVYSQRIYNNVNGIKDRVLRDLDELQAGRGNLDEIKAKLKNDFNINANEATRIVRTETNRVFNTATVQRYLDAGMTEIAISVKLDSRTSRISKNTIGYKFPLERGKYPILPLFPNDRCAYRAPKKGDILYTGRIEDLINK